MNWWENKSKKINLVFEKESWILPYVHELAKKIILNKYLVTLCEDYAKINFADISFFLGCTKLASKDILEKSKKNLVVHESDLPNGKGFSPLTWHILEGCNTIPVCLIEINDQVDSGNIIYKEVIEFEGHELNPELKAKQGEKTIELCLKYLNEPKCPVGQNQTGEPSYFKRRRPEDSKLNIDQSLREQFNLLRVVDNQRYPAYFELHGNKYIVKIEKNE